MIAPPRSDPAKRKFSAHSGTSHNSFNLAIIGLLDDLLGIWKIGKNGGGMDMKHRILFYTLIASIGAYWFHIKLGWDAINIPFLGNLEIGFWYVPLFVFIIVATSFSVNETDGLDGLAAGVMAIAFAAYIFVATVQNKPELAVFCSVIVGALLAFLWFNVNPARFFMGDTGAMPLGVTLGTLAMLTDTVLFLPLFGFILVIESSSVLVQMTSKKLRGKKIFLSTPIHHHFEAIGWPETKVTMRFWIISAIAAFDSRVDLDTLNVAIDDSRIDENQVSIRISGILVPDDPDSAIREFEIDIGVSPGLDGGDSPSEIVI